MGCDTEVERERIDKYEFNTADKRIEVYPSPEPDSPIVYINTFEGEGDNVCRALENMGQSRFYPCRRERSEVGARYGPVGYPTALEEKHSLYRRRRRLSAAFNGRNHAAGQKRWRMASRGEGWQVILWPGCLQCILCTDRPFFEDRKRVRLTLVPGLMDYITSHEMKRLPDCVYFSLGDLERRTRNPCLKTVQESTERIRVSMQATVLIRSFGSIRQSF